MNPADLIQELRDGLEGVTPGPWACEPMNVRDKQVDRPYVVGPSEIVYPNDGICEPDRMNDRSFPEDAANMRHIARCHPDNIRTLLDTLASKDTALAEIRAENERRKEWQDAIIGLCKAIGSDDMPWGGDKAGWGFIFYFVKHLHTRAEAAETELARAASRALSQEG